MKGISEKKDLQGFQKSMVTPQLWSPLHSPQHLGSSKRRKGSLQTTEAIYDIPCKNCPKTYIGETGRLFNTRFSEHRTDEENISPESFTRSQRKTSSSEIFKSAISEHVAASSHHVIGWDEARVIGLEPDKTKDDWKKPSRSGAGGVTQWTRTSGLQTWQNLWSVHLKSAFFKCNDVISSTKNCRFLETPHHHVAVRVNKVPDRN